MTQEIIRFGALPVSRWRNGAGRKADIASTEGWHVGFAWLDGDAAFSDFVGNDRTITLIDGSGFTLDFADDPALRVDELYHPSDFDGGWATQCHLLDGPCVVLNAMTTRTHFRHSVTILGGGEIPTMDRTALANFVVVLTGLVNLPDGNALQPKDAIRIGEPVHLGGSQESRVAVIVIHEA